MNKNCNDYYATPEMCIAENIDMPIYKILRNDEEIDVTEFGIFQSSMARDGLGDLLFYAYKELKSLRKRVEELEKKNEQ